MKVSKALVIFALTVSLFSCQSASEKELTEAIEHSDFDFSNLGKEFDNIQYSHEGNIQYGFINLEDGQRIKFWFLTHHATSDIGGTVYEFSNGDRKFYAGYHCCEVQFYDNGSLGKKFKDEQDFKDYIAETDGIRP